MTKRKLPHIFRYLAATCLLACFCFNVFAQSFADCDKLLKPEIAPDSLHQQLGVIMRANCFGLDSIDLKVFGNGPALGTLLVKLISNNNGKVTYGDLLAKINDAKKDTGYLSIRKVIIAQNMLEATIASASTWEKSRDLLSLIGTSPNEIENLHQFMLQNQEKNWNYRQMVVIYQQSVKVAKTSENRTIGMSNTDPVDILKSLYSRYCDTGKLIRFGDNLVAFSDYSNGLACAAKMHRSSLIFFDARYGVNCRRVESLLTNDPQITSYLKENFVIIDLKVDDKKVLPASLKTVGKINSDLEIEKFKTNYQPYIVIVDEHNKIKRSIGSINDSNTLLNFLIKKD